MARHPPECARIAAHLHPAHPVVLWVQRIMGLRISEAFGVLLGDVIELGDAALLAAQGQGGRKFNVRDDHGVVVAVPYKATMKTAAGSRVLVVPASMLGALVLWTRHRVPPDLTPGDPVLVQGGGLP